MSKDGPEITGKNFPTKRLHPNQTVKKHIHPRRRLPDINLENKKKSGFMETELDTIWMNKM